MRRFYEQVEVRQDGAYHLVTLDNRPLKTPLKTILQLPNRQLADHIAQEWMMVDIKIIPDQMPFFSLAVTVIDRVATQRDELSEQMQQYVMNDLICYRESVDTKLQEHQNKNWNPWLLWAKAEFNFDLELATGVMPINQKQMNAKLLKQILSQMNIWVFTCFVQAATLTGSTILALAFIQKQLNSDALFSLSLLDEFYQSEKWGEDKEAYEKRNAIKKEIHDLADFLRVVEQ